MTELIGDIEWYRGDSFPLELTIKNKATGLPITLTGYTFTLTIDTLQTPPDNTTKVFEVTGVVNPDQVLNKGKVSFTPTKLNTNLAPKGYFYDIQMQDTANNIRTIAKYKWKIVQDITKI